MKGLSEQERLIWSAGIFDGEGCINISRNRKAGAYSRLMIIVVMRELEPIMMLQSLFPGSWVNIVHRKNRNGHYHRWTMSGRKAADALIRWFPYLVVKRDQAQKGIDFQDHVDEWKPQVTGSRSLPDKIKTYRNEVAKEMSAMKRAFSCSCND